MENDNIVTLEASKSKEPLKKNIKVTEMSDASKFRKEVETKVFMFMDMFDPSGKSRKMWKDNFDVCKTDKEFVEYIKMILLDPQYYFSPEIAAFDEKRQPKFSSYKKIADFVKVPLEEYVVLPYLNANTGTNKKITTPTPIPVGYLHIKRLQQIVRKKNKLTTSIERRDQRTGQVIDEDKGGRMSDYDMYALSTISAYPVMKELYGPRADSMEAKEVMYKAIKDGTRLPRLSDLPNKMTDKTALNTMNAYILGASLMSNTISDDYMLPITKQDLASKRLNHETSKEYSENNK